MTSFPRVRVASWLVLGLVIGGGFATVIRAATPLKTWNSGDILDATDLNENFRNLQAQITQLEGSGVPPGVVAAFAGPVAPAGWLLCDGAKVERAKYAALFGVIGTVHGSGDNATTFNLPDYRGLFLRGVDGSAGRDPDSAGRQAAATGGNAGNMVGTTQAFATGAPKAAFAIATAGAHLHNLVGSLWMGPGAATGKFAGDATGFLLQQSTTDTQGDHSHKMTGGDKETRPANASVNFIIRY